MKYSVSSSSTYNSHASINIKQSRIEFGIASHSEEDLPNPAELFLGSFSACILKNVERFSSILQFEYSHAEIIVNATRLDNPPRMDDIQYELKVFSDDEKLNPDLLKKNIEKYGTIFNTALASCSITGQVKKITST